MTHDLAVEHEQEQARLTEEAAQRERDEDDRALNKLLAAVLPVEQAAHVRVRYAAATETRPARYIASWVGWASDDYRRVTRALHYVSDSDSMGREAALAYCRWASSGQDGYKSTPKRVFMAYEGKSQWSVLVQSDVAKKPEKVMLK